MRRWSPTLVRRAHQRTRARAGQRTPLLEESRLEESLARPRGRITTRPRDAFKAASCPPAQPAQNHPEMQSPTVRVPTMRAPSTAAKPSRRTLDAPRNALDLLYALRLMPNALGINALQFVIAPEPTTRRPSKGRRGRKPRAPRAPREKRKVTDPLEAMLREWRANEAKKSRIPAFRVMNDRTLLGIVTARPTGESELLDVSGIGPGLLGKYGKAILAIVSASR